MSFANPILLFGLAAILIPILIHLFNFRRYKTVYFSNVNMLDEIQKKTKKTSQIQQLIVLMLRILGISALVIACAQPFIKNKENKSTNGNLVSIFLDNSFSMETNSEKSSDFYDAVDAAKNIVSEFGYDDDFVLTTQDFSGEESHILTKDEMLELLDKVRISPNSRTFDDIVAFEKNTSNKSKKENILRFYISDFQKNNSNLSILQKDSLSHICLIPTKSDYKNNIGIDSCWFVSPVFKMHSTVTLVARVRNYGNENVAKVPVKLHVNDKQKAIAAVDIDANSYVDCRLTYRIEDDGANFGKLSIEDAPITFDDNLFFSYNVTDESKITILYDKEQNRYLRALYEKDSVFTCNSMDYKQINYSQLRESDLVVLNEIPSISSGLADELTKFVKAGGEILIFPASSMDNSVNNLLTQWNIATFGNLVENRIRCGKINEESYYFKDAFAKTDERIDMPEVLKYFRINGGNSGREEIMTLEDGSTLLALWQVGDGKVFLSSVAMRDDFGNAHKHALFFVPLHNIGILNSANQRLYNVIGVDNMQKINVLTNNSDDVLVLRLRGGNEEFIPEQRKVGNETMLFFHDQVHSSGWYDVAKGTENFGIFSFNFNRKESDMSCLSESELKEISENFGENVSVVAANTKNIAKSVTDNINGKPLWPLFVILSLLCFVAEIAILRFWNRPMPAE